MSSVIAIDPNDPTLVRGTPGDDRLILPAGGQAIGGGGDDIFVLTGGADGHLGVIHDFSPGDSLDVSALGARAKVLGLTSPGSQVYAIDFDGDDDPDGFVFVFEDHPLPVEPDFPIGGPSGPMPVDFEPFPIGGPVSEEVTILPFQGVGWGLWLI